MSERERSGRYKQGVSGNLNGRPKKEVRRMETLEDLDKVILDIANRQIALDGGSNPGTMSLVEFNVTGLMTGKSPNRLAAQASIDIIRGAATRQEQRNRRDQKAELRAYMLDLKRKGELAQFLEDNDVTWR